jgi:serine/threonine protein kinase
MLRPEGFLLGKCLASNERHEIYVAVRESDGRQVVLKTLRASLGSRGGDPLRREYEALRAVQGPGVIEVLDLLQDPAPVLVLAQAPGVSLSAWVRSDRPSVAAFLEVAIQLAAALERVHGARWIHCDVNPTNVIVEPSTLDTRIIDFGLARPLGAQTHSLEVVAHLAGTLAYVSPGTAGSMRAAISTRSARPSTVR